MGKLPLGRETGYPDKYAPELLHAIPRAEGRATLGIEGGLPFRGEDIWNAWELTWLESRGKPAIAKAEIRVHATSPNIIESKSMKLYLGSLAMTKFDTAAEIVMTLRNDLSQVAGKEVDVDIVTDPLDSSRVDALPGSSIDTSDPPTLPAEVDASVLNSDADEIVDETLHSQLLRSVCPVTGQPDVGSLIVRYRGPRIDPAGLLAYVVSFRRHSAFHEHCVERMFIDVKRRCYPEQLTVYARFNRRGGIDINPFRSDCEDSADDLRLWRQ